MIITTVELKNGRLKGVGYGVSEDVHLAAVNDDGVRALVPLAHVQGALRICLGGDPIATEVTAGGKRASLVLLPGQEYRVKESPAKRYLAGLDGAGATQDALRYAVWAPADAVFGGAHTADEALERLVDVKVNALAWEPTDPAHLHGLLRQAAQQDILLRNNQAYVRLTAVDAVPHVCVGCGARGPMAPVLLNEEEATRLLPPCACGCTMYPAVPGAIIKLGQSLRLAEDNMIFRMGGLYLVRKAARAKPAKAVKLVSSQDVQ